MKFAQKYDRPDLTNLLFRDTTVDADLQLLESGGPSSIPELESDFEELERAIDGVESRRRWPQADGV